MSDIDLTAAIEAGHRALSSKYQHPDAEYPSYRSDVSAVLDAVAPLIEAAVRDQIARDIEARMDRDDAQDAGHMSEGLWLGLNEATDIARGRS